MGGLIIRSALQHLEEYSGKMHMFMSLSSPHMGYMYHSSKIVDAGTEFNPIPDQLIIIGMWVLKKWKKSQGLKELTMTDSEKPEETYLYKLSKAKVEDKIEEYCICVREWDGLRLLPS